MAVPKLIEEKTFKMEEFSGPEGYAVIILDKGTGEIVIGLKDDQDDSMRVKLNIEQAQLMGDVLKDWSNGPLIDETEDEFKLRRYFEHLKEFASVAYNLEGITIPYPLAKDLAKFNKKAMGIKDRVLNCWLESRQEHHDNLKEEILK